MAAESKLLDALNILRKNNKAISHSEESKESTRKSVISKLMRRQGDKLRDALANMRQECLTLKLQDTVSESKDTQSKLIKSTGSKNCFDRLKQAQRSKLEEALKTMRLLNHKTATQDRHTVECQQLKDEASKKSLSSLLNKLSRAYQEKRLDALDRLKDNNTIEKKDQDVNLLENKVREVSEEAERQAEEAAMRLEQQNKDRKTSNMINRLVFAQESKERVCLQATHKTAHALANEEMMRQLKDEAANLIKKKSIGGLLNKMLNAQSSKMRDGLFLLRDTTNKAQHTEGINEIKERAQSKIKEAILKKFMFNLKKAQDAKCLEVLKNSKESNIAVAHQEEMRKLNEEISGKLRKKTLNHNFDRLVKAQQAKQREAFTHNKELNDAHSIQEAKEEAERSKIEFASKRSMTKLFEMLKTAQMGKKKDAFTHLNEKMAYTKLHEQMQIKAEEHQKDIQKKSLDKILQKLKEASLAKLAKAVSDLSNKAKTDTAEETIEGLKKAAAEESKNRKQSITFERLKNAQEGKEREAVWIYRDSVRKQIQAEQIHILNSEAAKRVSKYLLGKLTDRIKLACDGKMREMFSTLHENNRIVSHEMEVSKMKSQLMDKVKSSTVGSVVKQVEGLVFDELRWAFNNIKNYHKDSKVLEELNNIKIEAENALKKEVTSKLLDKLKSAQNAKLKHFIDGIKEKKLIESFDKMIKDKKTGHIFDRLKYAQEGKQRQCLIHHKDSASKSIAIELIEKAQEESTRKVSNKNISSMLDKISRCSAIKQLIALSRLKDTNEKMKAEESEHMMKNEMKTAIERKRQTDIFSRLKNAQEAKQKHALDRAAEENRVYQMQNAISESKEEMARLKKNVLTKGLLNRLKAAQESKMQNAFRVSHVNNISIGNEEQFKQEKEEIENIYNQKKSKDIFNKLKLAQEAKQLEVLKIARKINQGMIDEIIRIENEEKEKLESQQKLLKNIALRMKNAQDGKLNDALNRMREENIERAHQKASQKLRRFTLMNALAKACLTKSLDAFDRMINHYLNKQANDKVEELNTKITEEGQKRTINFILDKLRKAHRGKLDQSMKELGANSSYMHGIETLENMRESHDRKTRIKTILGLIQAQKNKQLYVYLKLRENNKDILADENEKIFNEAIESQKVREKNRYMFARLVSAQHSKQRLAFQNVEDNMVNKKISEEIDQKNDQINDQTKKNMFKLLFARLGNKRDDGWFKMLSNANISTLSKDSIKKNRIVSDLVNAYTNKKDHAFRKLDISYRILSYIDLNDKNKKNKFLRRLIISCEVKQKEVLYNLQKNKNEGVRVERERDMMCKNHLDRMFEYGIFVANKNKETCYMKMISYVNEEKRKEQKKKNLIQDLVKSYQIKLKNACYNLNQNKLLVWFDQKLNETIVEIELEKELGLKRKLLSRLCKVTALKAFFALKQLRYHNNEANEKLQRGKTATENLITRYVMNLTSNKSRVYIKMIEFGKKEKEAENKLKNRIRFICDKMNRISGLNAQEALNRLKQNNTEYHVDNQKTHNTKNNLFSRIVMASQSKKRIMFFNLMKNNKQLIENSLVEKMKSQNILHRLIVAQNFKLQQAFSRSKIWESRKQIKEINSKRKLENALNKLSNLQKSNAIEAVKSLRQNNAEEETKEKEKKYNIGFLLNKLSSAHDTKAILSIHSLKIYKEEAKKEEKSVKSHKNHFFNRLIASCNGKMMNSLNILKYSTDRSVVVERVEKERKLHILNRLMAGSFGKYADSMNRLQKYSKSSQLEAEKTKVKRNLLLNKLVNGQTAKLTGALDNMKKSCETAEKIAEARNQKLNLIANRLVAAQEAKKLEAISGFKNHNVIQGLVQEREVSGMRMEKVSRKMFISRILGGNTGKLKEAFENLRNNKSVEVLIEAAAVDKKKFIANRLSRACASKQTNSLNLMKENQKDGIIYNEGVSKKRSLLVARLVSSFNNQMTDALSKLQHNNQDAEEETRDANQKKNSMFVKLYASQTSKLYESFSTMGRFTESAEKKSDKVMNSLKLLINKITAGYNHKFYDAFHLLKDSNIICGKMEKIYNENMIFLLNRMIAAHTRKIIHSMNMMRQVKQEHDNKEVSHKSSIAYLVNRMNRASSMKQQEAILLAAAHTKDKYIAEEAKRRKRDNVVGKLMEAQNTKRLSAMTLMKASLEEEKKQLVKRNKMGGDLCGRLVRASQGKSREAVEAMRRNNVHKAISHKHMLTRLLAAYDRKVFEAYKQITDTGMDKGSKKQISLHKIFDAYVNKMHDSLRALRFATRSITYTMDKYLLMLVNGQTTKIRISMNSMIHNRSSYNIQHIEKSKNTNNLVNRLISAYNSKVNDSVRCMMVNRSHKDVSLTKKNNNLSMLFSMLKRGQTGKMQVSLSLLEGKKALDSQKEVKLNKSKNNLCRWLDLSSRGKVSQSIKSLCDNKSKEREREGDKKGKQGRMVRLFMMKNLDRMREAMIKMQYMSVEKLVTETRTNTVNKMSFNRLAHAQKEKQRTLYRSAIKQISQDNIKQVVDGSKKSFTFNKLITAQNMKCMTVFRRIHTYTSNAAHSSLTSANKQKYTIHRLIGGSTGKLRHAIDRMQVHQTNQIHKDQIIAHRHNSWISLLLRGQNGKIRDALFSLTTFSISKEKRNAKKENGIMRLMNGLDMSYKNKLKDAARGLISNRDETQKKQLHEEKKKSSAVKGVCARLVNSASDNLGTAIEKMKCHALCEKLIEERKARLAIRLLYKTQGKTRSAFNKFIFSSFIQKSLVREKNDKLERIVMKLYSRLIQGGMNKLIKNAYQKQRLINLINKSQILYLQKSKGAYFDRLKGLLKGNETVVKIIDSLQSKVRLRLQHGLDNIKMYYAFLRRDEMSNLANRIDEVFRKLQKKRIAACFNEIKSQYHNDNPWYNHSITKLSIMVPCSIQVAFWKIKVEKNFGYSLLPVQTSIKLKQFAELFEKKKQKTIQSAYTRIDIGRNITESMMNMSYLSSSHLKPPVPSSDRKSRSPMRSYNNI